LALKRIKKGSEYGAPYLQVPHRSKKVIHRLDEYGPLPKKILLIEGNPESVALYKLPEKGFSAFCEVFRLPSSEVVLL
jgi:hypothetical protein